MLLWRFKCLRCGYVWQARVYKTKVCPKCRGIWNKIKTTNYCVWTSKEIKQLKYLYEARGLNATEISKIMKRSKNSIKVKTVRMRFRHTPEQEFYNRSIIHKGSKNSMFGIKAWNNGLTVKDPRIKKGAIKVSRTKREMYKRGLLPDVSGKNNPMYGKSSWCKGLTKYTDKRLKIAGRKTSKARKKMFQNMSLTERDEIRNHCAEMGSKCKKKNTLIEIKIKKYLIENDIKFEQNYILGGFAFDFYLLDSNKVIECQGDYWHSNPRKYNKSNINYIQKEKGIMHLAKQEYKR